MNARVVTLGSFFQCAARMSDGLWSDAGQARDACMLHALRGLYGEARVCATATEALEATRAATVRRRAHLQPFAVLLLRKVRKSEQELGRVVRRFVQYHLEDEQRVYCVRTCAQLVADLCECAVRVLAADEWIWPSCGGEVLMDAETPMYVLASREAGLFCVRAARAEEQVCVAAPLLLLPPDEEPDMDVPLYALWSTDGEEHAQRVAPFLPAGALSSGVFKALVPSSDTGGLLYFVYPGDDSAHTLLPQLPPGQALFVLDNCDALLATITDHERYCYFKMPSDTRHLVLVQAGSEREARDYKKIH